METLRTPTHRVIIFLLFTNERSRALVDTNQLTATGEYVPPNKYLDIQRETATVNYEVCQG